MTNTDFADRCSHRGRRSARLLAGACALAVSAPLLAQAGNFPAPGTTRGSPPARTDSVVFSTSVRADSNVPRTSDDAPNILGLSRSDVTVLPALSLDVARPIGRHRIGLRSTLGYQFYLRNSRLNSENISVAPYADLALGLCALGVEGRVSRRQSNLNDLVYFLGADPSLSVKNLETRKGASASLSCGETYGLQPRLEVGYEEGSNSNPQRAFSDYSTTRVSPGVAYATPGLGEITLFANYQRTEAPNRTPLFERGSGYTLRGGGVRYRRAIGTRLNFDGRLAYNSLEPESGAAGTDGANYSVDLTYVASPRLQFVGRAARDFTSQLTGLADYEIAEDYSLVANYAASSRLRFNLGGSISPRRLVFDTPPPALFITRQTLRSINGGASYELNRRVRLRFDGGYQQRTSDVPIFDFDNYYVSAGVSISLGSR